MLLAWWDQKCILWGDVMVNITAWVTSTVWMWVRWWRHKKLMFLGGKRWSLRARWWRDGVILLITTMEICMFLGEDPMKI